jgi:hypothetical protein
MTAISLWQPWATLWLLRTPDEKVFETRDWYLSHRGPILVHAAKTRNAEVRDFLGCNLVRERLAAHGLTVESLTFGGLIGVTNVVGCSRMDRMPEPSEREWAFGHWEPERFAIEGRDPRLFDKPIPYLGRQAKTFEVADSVVAHEFRAPVAEVFF